MNVIETRNLTKIYGNSQIALNGANLTVPHGAVYGLVGPNGAGKTTTIRLLLGLHSPTAGTVSVFGEPMTANAVHLRQRIGFLPTNPSFPRDMNAIVYLDFVGKLFGLPTEVRKPRLAALLRAVGLMSASAQKIKHYSTGMVTRLGIAASLMNDPELLCWDEPTAGLDPEARKYTIDLIQELGKDKTLIVSSHNLTDIEKVCNYLGILSEGKLIFNGPIDQIKQFTRSSQVELELEGDLDAFCQQLASTGLTWERNRSFVRLTSAEPGDLSAMLSQALALIPAAGVTLTGINSLRAEMIDAFIRLLEEERSHGFSRILALEGRPPDLAGLEPPDDALSGPAGD